MNKCIASQFLKEYDEFDDYSGQSYKRGIIQLGKFDNFKDGDKVKEVGTPIFEITYSKDNGFGVYSCEDKNGIRFSIKGSFPKPLKIDQEYSIVGKLETYNSEHGDEKQIVVDKISTVKPTGRDGTVKYLQTLKGLKSRANTIYDIYGDDSIRMLKEKPLEVANMITGIGKKSVLSWQEELLSIEDNETELMYLMEIGLNHKQSNKLYKIYGNKVVDKVKKNPYILSKELDMFGFVRADEIARNIGYELNNPYRIQEAIIYTLESATNDGHCFLPREELIKESLDLLSISLSVKEMNTLSKEYKKDFNYDLGNRVIKIDYNEMVSLLKKHTTSKWNNEKYRYKIFEMKKSDIEDQFRLLSFGGRIIIESEKMYLEKYYQAEVRTAYHVNRIANMKKDVNWNIESKLDEYCKKREIELEDEQRRAVIRFGSSRGGIHILNGSAGCGKTFTLKIIIDMMREMYRELGETCSTLLLAPTGKASKVATKATGMECMTIHRGLKYSPYEGFAHNSNNPLDEEIIIVDESSMLDIVLAKSLLSAVKHGAKIILLGDTKQLPSVGPGNVLKDLIDSNKVDTITLTVPKRQEAKSGIIANANNIINGKMTQNQDTEDAFQTMVNNVDEARHELISLFGRIKNYKGYTFDEIQLLCPQRVGPIGTDYMNYLLQKEFNKGKSEHEILNKFVKMKGNNRIKLFFKEGDKVIHTKNNYDMYWYKKVRGKYLLIGDDYIGITNGECGVIETIIKEKVDGKTKTKVIVKYDEMYIIYEDGVKELDHAYALTVHKYQGSESPAIIIPIMMANYIMLDNNLFYTAYTRAESFITVVGERRAISHAINTHRSKHRYTTLGSFL